MEKEGGHVTERILDLTLEIIYLLTGEDYTVVKKERGKHVNAESGPPGYLVRSKRNLDKKILEVTQKIIELLMGEEWKHLEEQTEAVMEDPPPLPLPDGSRKRNPPQRCPRPRDSRDFSPEHQEMPHQGVDHINIKVEVIDDEEPYMMGEQRCKMEDVDMEIGYDRTDGQHHGSNPGSDHSLVLSVCKLEGDLSDQGSPEDLSTTPNLSTVFSGAGQSPDPCSPEGLSPDRSCTAPPNGSPDHLSPVQSSLDTSQMSTSDFHVGLYKVPRSPDLSNARETFSHSWKIIPPRVVRRCEKTFGCVECGRHFSQQSKLIIHRRIHTGEKPFPCLVCGKSFTHKSYLVQHQRIHSGEKPYLCSECGKSFTRKADLVTHFRVHTGEKPFPCSQCGKCFTQKSASVRHQRFHTGEKPYPCGECGKCFTHKPALLKHQKIHVRERCTKARQCMGCGKCMAQKQNQGT